MTQTLILSVLLVFVYQFDELVRGAFYLLSRLTKRQYYQIALNTDHYVGTALTIALMPMLLLTVLVSEQALFVKLVILAGIYLGFAIISFGVGAFIKEIDKVDRYRGTTALIAGGLTIAGLFYPPLRMVPWHAGRERLTYARLALVLSIPPFIALAFKWFYESSYVMRVDKYFDSLIIIMVGGLFINIVIRFLENYFRRHKVHPLGMFRIAIGLGAAVFLLL